MPKVNILVEVTQEQPEAFTLHAAMVDSEVEAVRASENLVVDLTGFGLEVMGDLAPMPMFGEEAQAYEEKGLTAFSRSSTNADAAAASVVVSCQVERSRLQDLESRDDIRGAEATDE